MYHNHAPNPSASYIAAFVFYKNYEKFVGDIYMGKYALNNCFLQKHRNFIFF